MSPPAVSTVLPLPFVEQSGLERPLSTPHMLRVAVTDKPSFFLTHSFLEEVHRLSEPEYMPTTGTFLPSFSPLSASNLASTNVPTRVNRGHPTRTTTNARRHRTHVRHQFWRGAL